MVDVDVLLGGVRALADADTSLFDDVQLRQLLIDVSALVDAATVVQARTIAEWDHRGVWQHDGSRCASSALSRDAQCSPGSARRLLARARRISRTPVAAAAVLDGGIGVDLLDLLGASANDDRLDAYQRGEVNLVRQCQQTAVYEDARRAVHDWAIRADEDLDLPPPDRHTSTAFVHHDRTAGVTELHAELGIIDGQIVRNELTRLLRQVTADDRHDGVSRSYGERLGVALARMATRSASARGGSARAVIQVIAGDETMRRACELASGEVLHTHELLPYLDTATFEAFLFGDRSTIITVSPSRTFRGALRRAIQVRDRHCQHESGCDIPATLADVDHVVPSARAGPTSQFNGRAFCTPHNRTIPTGTRQPVPERHLGPLDALRARLRWRCLHRSESEDRELDLTWHMAEVERLLHTPLGSGFR